MRSLPSCVFQPIFAGFFTSNILNSCISKAAGGFKFGELCGNQPERGTVQVSFVLYVLGRWLDRSWRTVVLGSGLRIIVTASSLMPLGLAALVHFQTKKSRIEIRDGNDGNSITITASRNINQKITSLKFSGGKSKTYPRETFFNPHPGNRQYFFGIGFAFLTKLILKLQRGGKCRNRKRGFCSILRLKRFRYSGPPQRGLGSKVIRTASEMSAACRRPPGLTSPRHLPLRTSLRDLRIKLFSFWRGFFPTPAEVYKNKGGRKISCGENESEKLLNTLRKSPGFFGAFVLVFRSNRNVCRA